ncbi:hypothetical protein V7S43_015098 [Phytophthora oleae]|uniref:FYVE-type domain-containing protein n=1 Tax=Phytophthora oleae TaxID=2107226 RepID=A0ABD3F132_9STRA
MTGGGFNISRSPFRPTSLSTSDSNKLQDVAKAILNANLDRYLHFSDVDASAWKLLKTKDGIQVYNRREQQFTVQSLLCIGSVPGKLDDLMFGVSDPTIETTNDFTVLQQLKAPTALDPFSTASVKWMELDIRRRSMGLVKNRDYVYVEATGLKSLPSGGKLGYHVMHSVGIPQAPNLPGRERSELSVCSFFRQVSHTSLSVYSMVILDSMSDRVRQFVVPRVLKTVQSTFMPESVGKVKKLAQNLGKRYSELDKRRPSNSGHCTTCTKQLGRLAKLTNWHNTCMVCSGSVCNSCKIEKKLKKFPTLEKETKKVVFCFSCLTDVMTSNASDFSFAENSDGDSELKRPAYHSVWSTRLPNWNISKSTEVGTDFSSTR